MLRRRAPATRKLLSLYLLMQSATASAQLLDFDDIDTTFGDAVIEQYQGLNWNNFSAYTEVPGFPGFNNGIISPTNALYSGGEVFSPDVQPVIGSVSSPAVFNFISANLGAGFYDELSVLVEGNRDGTTLFSMTVTVSTAEARFFEFNYFGIDVLSFTAMTTAATSDPFFCGVSNCTQFTLDNLRISEVPLPGAMLLLSSALVAAGVWRGWGSRVGQR